MMKRILFLTCLFASMLFCSCEYRWENREDLIGEWGSSYRFLRGARFIFYEDGTCEVKCVPTKEYIHWDTVSTLPWDGSEKFQEIYPNLERWDFSGYWAVVEDTLYSKHSSKPYYRYKIRMSPYREMLGTKQLRDSFMNSTNAEDAFWVTIDAWMALTSARLQCLSFYTIDPDEEYSFFKYSDGKKIKQ